MQKNTFIQKIKIYILKAFQIQLYMTIVSLPILINWGLPISLLSVFGNILFGPILTAFLFLSTLIFFFELINLPNSIFIYCLEKISNFWLYLLSFGNNKYLITFQNAKLFTIFLPIIVLLILHNKKINSLKKRLISFSLIFFISLIISFILKPHTNLLSKVCDKEILIINKENKIIIYDYKNVLSRVSQSFMQYNFLTSVNKNFGRCKIDTLITGLRKKSVLNCNFLIEKMQIDNVYFITKGNKNSKLIEDFKGRAKPVTTKELKLFLKLV